MKLLDCTLRDGGYYNSWDFSSELIEDYLSAMSSIKADYVELGLRSFNTDGFKGGCAYTTDEFISTLKIPKNLKLGVMVNASELLNDSSGIEAALNKLFCNAKESKIELVRVACHVHEFNEALPCANWLKSMGYAVGFNLMQVADRSLDELTQLARNASNYPLDVLYFADSMGSMSPEDTTNIVAAFKKGWSGALGIHTHDNMGQALANSIEAVNSGVDWVDGTVTGMGRGPGNVKTEYLVLALEHLRSKSVNITPLQVLIRTYFQSMQSECGWGSNPYYYLAGKYSIHPSYIQEMQGDSRYTDEDILAVIEHLKIVGGRKFNLSTLEAARHFYKGEPRGQWNPEDLIKGRDVLILGTGPGVSRHRASLEGFIDKKSPFVIALNTQISLKEELIDIRAACHPVRLLADCETHKKLPQPLVIPASMLPAELLKELSDKELLDYGIGVSNDGFVFNANYCQLPASLVLAYALAMATSGGGKQIYLAGFDGYGADDPRRHEADNIFRAYRKTDKSLPLLAITPTRYEIDSRSVYSYNTLD